MSFVVSISVDDVDGPGDAKFICSRLVASILINSVPLVGREENGPSITVNFIREQGGRHADFFAV